MPARPLTCTACGAAIALDRPACAACGAPIDADGDGVPDALAKMIEDKARALIAEEKKRESDEAAATARAEAARVARELKRTDEARLARMRDALQENSGKPRPVWHLDGPLTLTLACVALLIGGVLFPACLEPMAGRSLVAAQVFCPGVCAGCRGPGRVFTWHESGGSYEGNVSTQLCHNATVDIDRITWMDVTSRQDSDLAPYRLTLWSSVPLDAAIVFLVLLAVGPFWFGRMRTRSLGEERRLLAAEIEGLERNLAAGARPPQDAPYR